MFPNQCPHTLNGEQCAYTVHEGRHTFDLTMAEAADTTAVAAGINVNTTYI